MSLREPIIVCIRTLGEESFMKEYSGYIRHSSHFIRWTIQRRRVKVSTVPRFKHYSNSCVSYDYIENRFLSVLGVSWKFKRIVYNVKNVT